MRFGSCRWVIALLVAAVALTAMVSAAAAEHNARGLRPNSVLSPRFRDALGLGCPSARRCTILYMKGGIGGRRYSAATFSPSDVNDAQTGSLPLLSGGFAGLACASSSE